MYFYLRCILFIVLLHIPSWGLSAGQQPKVKLGIEVLLQKQHKHLLEGKRVALCTNHTAVTPDLTSSIDLIKSHAKKGGYQLVAFFGPEHGIDGSEHAEKGVAHSRDVDGLPIYSLHGQTRRPTDKMLKDVDVILYDIQDIGSRSYTYISTLFYIMEKAAKRKIRVVVCDRPNPINGMTIDGPMLEEEWRSFVGYVDVPYIHGMTVGELAQFFNAEYKVGCPLTVIPMRGWKRSMSFKDTGLPWIPTSPHIPEADTPLFYPTTGILGELQIVSIGIGYTLPFKLVGAPWIDGKRFAKHLNDQNFPGVSFQPFTFSPFYGRFAKETCHGVFIVITDSTIYQPVSTQYLILGILKTLYPKQFKQAVASVKHRKKMFCKVNGTDKVYDILTKQKYIVWTLKALHHDRREAFRKARKRYLMAGYGA